MTATIRISPQYTLGGGNHFIEVCLDGENPVWVMLHSGSRGGAATPSRMTSSSRCARVWNAG